jgi:hypothetical protein
MKYKLTLGFLVVVILLLIYFRRDVLSKTFSGYINASWLNDILGNLWLSTHLTSSGELASIYVPSNFSSIMGMDIPLETPSLLPE